MEDDCVPQADFFSFCAALLHRYRDDERIMLISGSNLIDHLDIPESYLFSRWYNIWGWATWRRAWQLYDFEMGDWAAMRQTKLVEQAYPDKYVSRYLRKSFDLLLARKINTWDIQWFYTCLRSSGLCIAPRVNLIANIGTTGTHTQAGHGGPHPTAPLDTGRLLHPQWVHAHPVFDAEFFKARFHPTVRSEIARYTTAIRLRIQHLRKSRPTR